MAYPHSLKIQGLLAKEEVTYGTDPTPVVGTDGIRVVGDLWPGIQPEWAFPNEREDVNSGTLVGSAPGTPKGRIVSLEVTVELKGAGAAYSSVTPVRPEADPLFIACAMSRTHDDTGSAESVTYANADTGHGSCTIWAYAGGKLFKIVGCRGSWTWDIAAGGLGRITFRMMGMLSTAPTEVALPSITYDSVMPPATVGIGLAIVPSGGSSWTPAFAAGSVDMGQDVQRLDDSNGADGIEGFFIDDTKPSFRITPRAVDLSDYPGYALAATRTAHTVDATVGSTQYNRMKLDVNDARLLGDPPGADDTGFAAWDLEYRCWDLALVFD